MTREAGADVELVCVFLSPSTTPKLSDIYSLYTMVVDEIIKLFDHSVWSLRDIVRVTELVKLRSYMKRAKGFNNYF